MTNQFDSLKSQWQSLNAPFSSRGKAYASEILRRRNLGSVNMNPARIARVYMRLTVVSAAWVVLSLLMSRSIYPMWLASVLASFFAIMAAMCYSVREAALEIDFSRMSVVEALEAVCRFQRKLRLQRAAGYMIALPILVTLFYYFAGVSQEMVWGGITGGVIGGAIGLSIDRKIRRQVKEMKSVLHDAVAGCDTPAAAE